MTQIRVIVLTSRRKGTASRCLPALCSSDNIVVAKVVLANGLSPNIKRLWKRKIEKVYKIGIMGAVNGVRLRAWYEGGQEKDIENLCEELGVPCAEAEFINCERTRQLFGQSEAELGLSLGNGYIPESVFSIPKFGMINIHGERLPEYQNAQSVIWPIYNSEKKTGLTIHQIDKKIDTGEILYQETYPIEFHSTLEDTVRHNVRVTGSKVPAAIRYVCENYPHLRREAKEQSHGRSYTTPSFWQFLRMVRNNRRLYKETQARSRQFRKQL